MRIQVEGTLFFNGGGSKLSLPCGSLMEIMSSRFDQRERIRNNQSITICAGTFWQVSDGHRSGYVALAELRDPDDQCCK